MNANDAIVQIHIKPGYSGRDIILSIYELGWVKFPYDKFYTWEYTHNRKAAKEDKITIIDALSGYTHNRNHQIKLKKTKRLAEGEAYLTLLEAE